MGICTTVWRCRIGSFVMPRAKNKFNCPKLDINMTKLIRLSMVLNILLIIGGIESNPGPTGKGSTRSSASRQASQNRKLSSQSVLDVNESGEIHVRQSQLVNDPQNLDQMLTDIRMDLNTKLIDIQSNLGDLNSKVNQIADSCEERKAENDQLKQQNEILLDKVCELEARIDNVEGQSRRNNLLFHGISGPANERWDDTEDKVRSFVSDNLHLPSSENDLHIERAHRLKSRGNRPNGPIIVKFSNYKQREAVKKVARKKLDSNSSQRVSEDFTTRVRDTRKLLGTYLVQARKSGRNASMRYDKLVIDGEIFKLDADTKKPVKIATQKSYVNSNFVSQTKISNRDSRQHTNDPIDSFTDEDDGHNID